MPQEKNMPRVLSQLVPQIDKLLAGGVNKLLLLLYFVQSH